MPHLFEFLFYLLFMLLCLDLFHAFLRYMLFDLHANGFEGIEEKDDDVEQNANADYSNVSVANLMACLVGHGKIAEYGLHVERESRNNLVKYLNTSHPFRFHHLELSQ